MKKAIIFLMTLLICFTITAQVYDECDKQYKEATKKAYDAFLSKGREISNYYSPKFDAAMRDYSNSRINYTDLTNEYNRLNRERQNAWNARDAKYNQDLEKIRRERDACYGIVKQNYVKRNIAEQQRKQRQAQQQRQTQQQQRQAQQQQEAAWQAQQERNRQIEAHNKQVREHNTRIRAKQAEARRQAYLEAQRRELEAQQEKREGRVNTIAKPAQQNINDFTSAVINAAHVSEAQGRELEGESLLAKHDARNQGRDISVTSQMPSEYATAMMKDNNGVVTSASAHNIARHGTIKSFSKGDNARSITNKDNDPAYIYVVSNDPNAPSIQKARDYSDNDPCMVEFTDFFGNVQTLQFENYNQFKIYVDQKNKRNQQSKEKTDKAMKNLTDNANYLSEQSRAMAADIGMGTPSQTITFSQIKANSYKVMKAPVSHKSTTIPPTTTAPTQPIAQNPVQKSAQIVEKPKKEETMTNSEESGDYED
jgi:hypothetical protein